MPKVITTTTTVIEIDETGTPGEVTTDTTQKVTASASAVTVYTLDELSPEARERALDKLREERNAGWDDGDRQSIAEVIVATLAEKLGTPGVQDYGVSDFPGIDGVEVEGWDIDRGSIAVAGTLTRDNAPALPWVLGIEHVELTCKRSDYTVVDVADADPECSCETADRLSPHEPGCPVVRISPATDEQRDTMEQAVRDAISAAIAAGQAEWEYQTGDECLSGNAEANDRQFTEDGDIYS